ncbi:MAG TPA: flagellar protein FliS [Chitinispirillaceae bacterium]|nr:flagellar protein FliS [Chitinispirillaceae bacterium]
MLLNEKHIKDYSRIQVQTATHARVICMLHEKCEQLIRYAIYSEDQNGRLQLDRAQNIIVQLERSLIIVDQVSRSLYLLYDYCYCALESGTVSDSKKALQVITALKDTFTILNKRPKN